MSGLALPRTTPARAIALASGLGLVAAATLICLTAARLTGLPAPVLAVAAGLALTPLAGRLAEAFQLCAKPGLKLGVAMMGAQVAWAEVAALGWQVAAASGAVVAVSLAGGAVVGLALGLPLVEALIAACAVSICGASAAMAAASALPQTADSRRTTALVVVGVNLLSTAAMALYPLIAHQLGLSDRQAGVFLGFSIHDVAQVVAAGEAVSPQAAAAAALAKLTRILWLGPAVVLIGLALAARRRDAPEAARAGLAPPLFVWGFLALLAARNLGLIPPPLVEALAQASRVLLVAGVIALTAQLSPRELLRLDPRLALSLGVATLLIAGLALAAALVLVA